MEITEAMPCVHDTRSTHVQGRIWYLDLYSDSVSQQINKIYAKEVLIQIVESWNTSFACVLDARYDEFLKIIISSLLAWI